MSEKPNSKEQRRNFWKGVAFLGALVLGAEILFDL